MFLAGVVREEVALDPPDGHGLAVQDLKNTSPGMDVVPDLGLRGP